MQPIASVFCYMPRALTPERRAAGDSWNVFCAVKELSDYGCPRRHRSDARADVGLHPQPSRPSGTRYRQRPEQSKFGADSEAPIYISDKILS